MFLAFLSHSLNRSDGYLILINRINVKLPSFKSRLESRKVEKTLINPEKNNSKQQLTSQLRNDLFNYLSTFRNDIKLTRNVLTNNKQSKLKCRR